ncbi:efflux RND transporter permease subunit [Thalassobacter stenotrophicus]|uniref:efflux RND transporter permease subunit n=1 Tax=Thalassobacter stenotrophicus TaxID=266809 RepID=UPI000D5DBD95|nr:efflux RND transporter permease subunit [Thalassobacter stenotrophicus]PVZ47285.1 multidrug transporter AcrB [Thalassobacter stenotrophicus]
MNLARFAIEKRVISALATLLILLGGYFAYTALPRFEDPEFIIRQAQIVTPYPGASAEEVAEEVSDLIEGTLQQLSGVKEIVSVSSPDLSQVTIEFTIASSKSREALAQKFTQMRAKISDVQSRLPPNAQPSQVYDDFGDVYALYFAITGDGYSLPELYAYAKDLQRELVLVDGVSKIILSGNPEEVIYVEYAPARLTELGITPSQIADVLKGQNLVSPAGSIRAGANRLALRMESAVGSTGSIGNLVLTNPQTGASFRLSDIAEVRRGVSEPPSKLLYRDGKPAIGIGISNAIGGNVVNMGDALKARMDELISERPIGIEIEPISDQSSAVKTSVADFVTNVVLALAIVVGTLLVFMGLRSGLLMGGILLVTVAGTLLGMYFYGLNMQRISLGALIIALGMLVDNAIVVVEGTLVRVQKGEDTAKAATSVVDQTKWPLLGGTVVGFLAFSPIGFSPDNTGEYASSLFWTITIALLFSWLVAVWLTPYFCTLLLKAPKKAPSGENFILRGYRGLLHTAIRLRYLTMLLVVGLFASAIIGFSFVPPGFFPTSTRAQFVVDYSLPAGTDIATTGADLLEIDAHIRTLPDVTGTNMVLGGGHSRFMLTYSAEDSSSAYGQILVDVEDYRQIDAMRADIQSWIDNRFVEANAKVWKFVLGPGGGAAIEARFSGPDQLVLRQLAAEAKDIMAANGAIAIKDDWGRQQPVLRPIINTDNARRLGLTQGEIGNALYSHLNGARIGVYREGDTLSPIIMRPYERSRSDVSQLREVRVFSQVAGDYIPISQVVDRFELVNEASNLRRVDRSLTIMAQSDNPPGMLSGDLFEAVQDPIEAIELPPGYTLEWKGIYGSSLEANAGLASTMPIGFGAMIVVVLLLFNAVRQPLIIWLTVPLALIGVVWGLVITQTALEFMAILGILSLTGMLIKNAIVLIDETDSLIAAGRARMQSVLDAAVSRARPVTLGVVTTVLGVIPLIWDPFFNSLAVVIICGLSFATILTLIVVPTLYAIFFGVKMDEMGAEPAEASTDMGAN